VIDQAAFLSAYLRGRRRGTKRMAYEPRKLSWFTVQDALKRLTSLLGSMPDWTSLERFLPEVLSGRDQLEHRAALSSTLMAGLELARGGHLRLQQEVAFGPILVGAKLAGPTMDGPILDGPILDGPILGDPILGDPILGDPILGDPILGDPIPGGPGLESAENEA